MADYDVFNGDADGICALVQLRLAEPRDATLVTGVKRDIALLDRVAAGAGDRVTVLDVSMDKNASSLERILDAKALVFYADHHFAGEIPATERLDAHVDTDANTCTSLIINGLLGDAYASWAVAGAFGDNLLVPADRLARSVGLDEGTRDRLRKLGTLLNYNGYGSTLEDLHFSPAELFQRLRPFEDPLEFMDSDRATFEQLESGYESDMAAATSVSPAFQSDCAAMFLLPNEAWARRVGGILGNDLANRYPARAHAVVTERPDGDYLVSVRAPLDQRTGADEICRRFTSGGGRKAAAGINQLPAGELELFSDEFSRYYQRLSGLADDAR